jgi:hypothetical protein
MNKIISTETDVLRRAARKSRMEGIKKEHIKKIMGVKGKPNIVEIIETKDYNGVSTQKDARGKNTKINYGVDPAREKEKRTPKEDLDRRGASSNDSEKCGARAVEKQGGMAFGFRKTATAVIISDGWMDGWMDGRTDRQAGRQAGRQVGR